jgi:hypothetical protein
MPPSGSNRGPRRTDVARRGNSDTEPADSVREQALLTRYGEVMTARQVSLTLHFPSVQAFRKAHRRVGFPFPLFPVPGRRELYASTREVASFLNALVRQPGNGSPNSSGPTHIPRGGAAIDRS